MYVFLLQIGLNQKSIINLIAFGTKTPDCFNDNDIMNHGKDTCVS